MALTNQTAIQQILRAVSERINRELRYTPNLHGKIIVGISFRDGVATGIEVESRETRIVEAIEIT